jgi:TonB family protein
MMQGSWTVVAEGFYAGLLVHLWQTTLVLALLGLLSRPLRSAPARLLAGLWGIGLLKLFLPLSLFAPITARVLDLLTSRLDAGPATVTVRWFAATIWLQPVTLQPPAHRPAVWTGWLWVGLTSLWVCGLAWLLTRRLLRARRRSRLHRAGEGAASRRLERRLRAALALAGVPRGRLVLARAAVIPAVRGLLRPRIVLPPSLVDRLEADELAAVLLHEDEHCRRRDPLLRLPGALAAWLFFFYPPVHWLLRRRHEATEMACDEAVLRAGVAPATYARAIARTLAFGIVGDERQPALAGPSGSSIRRRLERLQTARRVRTMPCHRWTLAAAGLCVLLGSAAPLTPGVSGPSDAVSSALPGSGNAALDRLRNADRVLTLELQEAPLDEILKSLAAEADWKLELDSAVTGTPITISWKDRTAREALVELSGLGRLVYEVPDAGTLRVRRVMLPGKDGVTPPVRIPESLVQPSYPEALRKAGIQGAVLLQTKIDRQGRVSEVEVLHTEQPDHPSMAAAAIEAIEQWRYEPATLEGQPVEVYVTLTIQFRLDNTKRPASERKGEML